MTTALVSNPTTLDDLVGRLQAGEAGCWTELITRFQPLVDSLTRRFRLSSADAGDVSQTVWLRLFTHIQRLRDPRALPGWIVTTTSRACMDALNVERRTLPLDPQQGYPSREASVDVDRVWSSAPSQPHPDEVVVEATTRAELRSALQRGLAELSPVQRNLLILLLADPPLSYLEISQRLAIPMGSIGPTRARALAKLRQSSALRRIADERLNPGAADNVRQLPSAPAVLSHAVAA